MNFFRHMFDEPKRLLPVIPLALSFYVIFSTFSRPGITADGQTYLQIARNLHFGIGLGWQSLWVPPLHSILVALVGWVPGVPDLLMSSAIVGAVTGILLTAAVWLLASEFFGRSVALGASTIAALYPHFLWISKAPEAECTYTALLVCSLWLFCVALRKQAPGMLILSGIAFSLTYMSRSEGFLIMLFVVAAALLSEWRRGIQGKMVRFTAILLLAFLLTSLPYLLFLRKHYGGWVISPKSTYVLIWMKSRIYHDNDLGEVGNEELWGLTDSGKLKWQVPSGFGDVASYLMSHPAKSAQVYLANLLREVPGRIPNNSGMEQYPQIFPVILALAAVFASFRSWGDRSCRNKAVFLSPFLILIVLPVFTEGWWKYLVPYAPLLIILGCAGIAFATESLFKQFSQATRRTISLAVMLILALYFRLTAFPVHLFPSQEKSVVPAPQPSAEIMARRSYAADADKAGRWIAQTLGPGHNYMVPWSKLIYPLNGLWTAMPVAEYPRLHAYAERQGAEYFLVEMDGSVPVKQIEETPPGLKYVTMYRAPQSGYTVAVYRFVPL
ncbi:MAG: glycosyltransferase family 39 protein [Desulfuromonadales bacterium]|nr:glycosyltransferase family 39 protein [Desulfuromonadales bacterium]